jgi:hypothetical protein
LETAEYLQEAEKLIMVGTVRASALYIVIVIALAMAVLCSALITIAYFYRSVNEKNNRYTVLESNLRSAVNILIAGQDTAYNEKSFSLFGEEQDSITTKKIFWGLYDIGIAHSFIHKDTLCKVFSIAHDIDSTAWCALYLADNGRPLGLSGKAAIQGDVFIPHAGVTSASIDNQGYTGDKNLVSGKKHDSKKELPGLDSIRLQKLKRIFKEPVTNIISLTGDSLIRSFTRETILVDFKDNPVIIHTKLSGNIILFSDTSITIDSLAHLQNVIVVAKKIIVNSGFRGNCQLFATDQISVGQRCQFKYPSSLGVLKFGKSRSLNIQPRINIGDGSSINGTVFIYQEQKAEPGPLISLGNNTLISGQLYAQETLQIASHSEIDGCAYVGKLVYQSSITRYENYLVNIRLDENALSPYYLPGGLLPAKSPKKKILEWITEN